MYGAFGKRLVDLALTTLLLIVLAPLILAMAVLVRLKLGFPVLFCQQRPGLRGKPFSMYKFRTMTDERDAAGYLLPDAQRLTRLGRFLRSTSLDELPELYNVLRGDMSLVGPRPERPYFVRQYEALQGLRLAVKPGVTGLAQIRGCYDLKPEHKARYDSLYIKRRSLRLNLYILSKTVPVVLTHKGW